MSRIKLVAQRTAVRAREERYFRRWKRHTKKGRTLRTGSPEQAKNRRSRIWYKEHYLAARKKRKALDNTISKLPITQVDQAGIDFIKREEGVVLHPYNDSRGFATVGVGHLLHQSPVTPADRNKYSHFDQHDADVLLARDLDGFEKAVAQSFSSARALTATHNRFNALVSLAFNIGVAGYSSSTAAHGVLIGNVDTVVRGIRMWHRPPELAPRREREVALFTK